MELNFEGALYDSLLTMQQLTPLELTNCAGCMATGTLSLTPTCSPIVTPTSGLLKLSSLSTSLVPTTRGNGSPNHKSTSINWSSFTWVEPNTRQSTRTSRTHNKHNKIVSYGHHAHIYVEHWLTDGSSVLNTNCSFDVWDVWNMAAKPRRADSYRQRIKHSIQ